MWDFGFSRNLTDSEVREFSNLSAIVERVRLHGTIQYRRDWVPDHNGMFSVKSSFSSLIGDNSTQGFIFHDNIWKTRAPKKVQVFCWLIALNKLSTHDLLQRRNPFISLSPGWCCLCKEDRETADHIFLHCPFSQNIWAAL